jgi:hypothetical protein
VVDRLAGMKGVTGGELRGGRRLREDWELELRWLPIGFERWGGSARSRGVGRWHWMDWGGPARDEWDRSVAAAELAGDEADGLPPSIAGYGSTKGMA